MPGDIYLFHHDSSQPLSPSRHYQCYVGHPHILCTPIRPQTNQNKFSVKTNKVESVILFFFPSETFALTEFSTVPSISYTPRRWASQHIFISPALLQVLYSYELHAQLKRHTRDTELTTKCSWLNSFWSCSSNFAFSSGDFCREFKASSSNSLFRVAVIFSPGSTIPLEAGETNKQKNAIPQILHILTPRS